MSSRVLGCQATPLHLDPERQNRREKMEKRRVTSEVVKAIWGELSSNHRFFKFFSFSFYFMCRHVFFLLNSHWCTTCVFDVWEGQRRALDLWDWSCKQPKAVLCVLGIAAGSLWRTDSGLNHWAVSPAHSISSSSSSLSYFFKQLSHFNWAENNWEWEVFKITSGSDFF